ncbi:MAG: hypothetical protein ACP5IN_02395 [Caldimicrobium sp.]
MNFMIWSKILPDFFENLFDEKVGDLLTENPPWEVLKKLKEFLFEIVFELPRLIPLERPLPESLFLTTDGELIPLKEIKRIEGKYYFKDEEVKGAILMAGAILKGKKIFFEEGVIVEPYAYLEEPCYFSAGTQIRHCAYVRGSVYTGKGAVIGHTTEVKNSIFLSQAKAAHFAYVGDCILGREVNLGAGTKLANFKFMKKEITLQIEGEIIKTGLKKMGAVLGDRVQTGCNSVIQPGTLIAKNSFVYPGVSAPSGYFPKGSKIKV